MDHSGHGSHGGHGGHGSHAGHGGMDHAGMDHAAMGHSEVDTAVLGAEGRGHTHDMGGTTLEGSTTEMMHMHDMGGMSMFFHFGYNEVILFEWWKIDSIGGLIGSMIGIFVLSLLYEGLKYWRDHLMRRAIAKQQYVGNQAKPNMGEDNKHIQYMEQILMPPRVNMLSSAHIIQTTLHILQMVISYFLMLIFMTYNVWLCIAVILGAGVGYFLFGWKKSVVVDITEHCH